MSNYLYIKDAQGHSRVVQAPDVPEPQPVKLVQPGTTVAGKPQRFRCTVEGCGKKFATQGVFSIHYNRTHRQGESKDEWRSFVEKTEA